MIRIELLPAAFGDCILVEYGEDRPEHRILIDAGLTKTYEETLKPRLERINGGDAVPLEILVVTHIDRDHICGILPLLRDAPCLIEPRDIWFNGRHHLTDDALGPKDGEALGKLLAKKDLRWNADFGEGAKKAVVVPDTGPLPELPLAGGAVLTLLSPYAENLRALGEEWDDTLGAWDEEPKAPIVSTEIDDVLGKRPATKKISTDIVADFADSAFKEDHARPNGSSIAFLLEYGGKRLLFGADAHPSVLLRSLERYSPEVVELDAFKISHHGSENNTSADLLAKVDCQRYLLSTNGDSFGHPHAQAISRIIMSTQDAKALCFNYSCDYTSVWDDAKAKKALRYSVEYPEESAAGYVLEL